MYVNCLKEIPHKHVKNSLSKLRNPSYNPQASQLFSNARRTTYKQNFELNLEIKNSHLAL